MGCDPNLQSVVLALTRSLSRLLTRAGLDAREFSELAKLGYVEAVRDDYGRVDRPASISQTARVTGLSRAEVKRLLEDVKQTDLPPIATSSAEGVTLHYWYSDPDYLDDQGEPASISFGPGKGSFRDLVARYLDDDDPEQLLQRLQEAGCVELKEDGQIGALKRNFSDPDAVPMALASVESLAATMVHNSLKQEEPSLLQRTVYSHTIDPADLMRVRRLLRDKAANFCEEVDDLFMGLEVDDAKSTREAADANLITSGLGVYYYEKPTE